MAVRKTPASPPDRVDRALTSVRGAIGRLVGLLGDEDEAVVEKAAVALAEVGPFAVGPLAAALPRAPSPRHRAAIIGALLTFGPQAKSTVMRALVEALKREPDPRIQVAAQAALTALLMPDPRSDSAPGSSPGESMRNTAVVLG